MICEVCGTGSLSELWRVRIDKRGPSRQFVRKLCGAATPDINVLRCTSCRCFKQYPVLPEYIYSNWYLSEDYSFDRGQGYEGPSGEKALHARKVLSLLSKTTAVAQGSILDVGCNDGVFLSICKEAGWRVMGCEMSPKFAAQAVERFGVDVTVGPFLSLAMQSEVFDVVSFWDVFEHFLEPNRALDKVRSMLKRGGWIALEVPNAESLFRKLLGKRWWFGFEHVFYYTPRGLDVLLRRNGFEPVHIETDNVNLLKREGLVRLGFFGADAVWGRGKAAARILKGGVRGGKGSGLLDRWNDYINTRLNGRLLGDQLRIIARRS